MAADVTSSPLASPALLTPLELYRRAEQQQWSAFDMDLRDDVRQWEALAEELRRALANLLVPFYLGEQRVAMRFTALIDAAADENEASYLATQLVDEARHMHFFDRYLTAISAVDGGDLATRVESAGSQVNDAFKQLFDAELDAAANALADDPSVEHRVDFVATYHMVIEGMLALAGQEALTVDLRDRKILPVFAAGVDLVARDEHRHLAYGAWALDRDARGVASLEERLRERFARLVPLAVQILGAPHQVDIARQALRRRMGAIGLTHVLPTSILER